MKPTDPWSYAVKQKRQYITPDDITRAQRAGANRLVLAKVVFAAIEMRMAEDYRLCAFVMLDWLRKKTTVRRTAAPTIKR